MPTRTESTAKLPDDLTASAYCWNPATGVITFRDAHETVIGLPGTPVAADRPAFLAMAFGFAKKHGCKAMPPGNSNRVFLSAPADPKATPEDLSRPVPAGFRTS